MADAENHGETGVNESPVNGNDDESAAKPATVSASTTGAHGYRQKVTTLSLGVALLAVVAFMAISLGTPIPGVALGVALVAMFVSVCAGLYKEALRDNPWPSAVTKTVACLLVCCSFSTLLVAGWPSRDTTQVGGGTAVLATTVLAPIGGSQAGTSVANPLSTSLPITPAHTCPARGTTQRQAPDVEICIVYWCMAPIVLPGGTASESTSQVKLRPKIENNSNMPLDLSVASPSSMRLLVSSGADYRWDPPPLTAAAGDRVVRVQWEGATYWAVPPNVAHDASPIYFPDGSGTWDGFVSSWEAGLLEPGDSMNKPLRLGVGGQPIQEGNLVFQVPSGEDALVAGLAVVTRDSVPVVLAASMFPAWPPQSNLNDF
ncbi:hypothetical protein RhoFasGS6_01500 [Rhodococcus fascians]|nr:hypothetical protein [Rhodococcus fascians]